MSTRFVTTGTVLDRILARKSEDLSARMAEQPSIEAAAASAAPARDFVAALRARADAGTLALIAEVKKASPSKGVLIADFDPVALGRTYAENGAAAISVLTDEPFFQGRLEYMSAVRAAVAVPVLRKDFIIDPFQVYEARSAGADAVLLIVAALTDAQLRDLHDVITALGMAALVEAHNEAEMERALLLGAPLIGINNRDLATFHEDLTTTERLAQMAPPSATLVAESAMRSVADVRRMGEIGAHAVLIGEGLVTAADIGAQVRAMSSQKRARA